MKQDNYSDILDHLFEGVLIIDNEFKIKEINKAASQITGFKKNEAVGKFCFEILKADACTKNCPIKALKEGKEQREIIVNIINKENEEKYIKVKAFPFGDNWIEIFQDITREYELERRIKKGFKLEDIITRDKNLLNIISALPKIAKSNVPVLIEGESGVGKEVFATAIKNLSDRKNKPFVKINCAALPDTLLESELFGYKKGAFTDAKKDKPGLFVQANKGTIFLDEVGEMSQNIQAKLLRVVETGEIIPLGSTRAEKVDVRVISATNKNLSEEVKKGNFREDLFYRLNVVNVKIPPLRERKGDIPLFIDYFIYRLNIVHNKKITGISKDALNLLLSYNYPGNIRELRNILEYAYIFCEKGEIKIDHLPEYIKIESGNKEINQNTKEKEKILKILEEVKWNKRLAAQKLGINRTTLWRKMKKLGIS